jgi:hypothetical protein
VTQNVRRYKIKLNLSNCLMRVQSHKDVWRFSSRTPPWNSMEVPASCIDQLHLMLLILLGGACGAYGGGERGAQDVGGET